MSPRTVQVEIPAKTVKKLKLDQTVSVVMEGTILKLTSAKEAQRFRFPEDKKAGPALASFLLEVKKTRVSSAKPNMFTKLSEDMDKDEG